MQELLHAPGAEDLKKAALLDALWCDDRPGEVSFLQTLKQVPPRVMLLEMEVDEDIELILKCHLQESIASSHQGRNCGKNVSQRLQKS